jgi:exopolyphosphatase/guanosine-5'-triphosphate,3'-diphosphate pyrophosphatase
MIACDLGSNTFRVVEIDCDLKVRLKEFERVVRTADGITHDGKISDEAIKRIIKAIQEAKEIFDLSHSKAVTTAAMRKASNSDEVLEHIFKATGLEFEVIDSKKEAFYVRVAVENVIKVKDNYIIMDLGGGSTELILKHEDISFDIGIVTMVDKYMDINEGIEKEFEDIRAFSKRVKGIKTFVATAGTPTTVASYIHGLDCESYDYKKINGTILTLSQIDDVLADLLEMSESQRVKWVGTGKADLIIAGIVMFKEIVKIFGFDEVLVIDDGLREGVALENCISANSYRD